MSKKIDINSNGESLIFCDVCGVTISFPFNHKRLKKEPTHFHDVCKQHKEYATRFLIEPITEMLNFEYISVENKNCKICNEILTYKEVHDCLRSDSLNYLCKQHLESNNSKFIP